MMLDRIWGREMALVIVDVQRKFSMDTEDWPEVRDAAVKRINLLADMFRSYGKHVFFVATDGVGHNVYRGEDGDWWLEGIRCLPGDIVIHKKEMSSFKGTDLEAELRKCGVDCILVAGMYTEMCVIGTYFSASERDFFPCIAEGAVIAYGEGINDAVGKLLNTVTPETVEKFLNGTQEFLDPKLC